MSTTRMGSGLAFTPQKDLKLFATMAARGQILTSTSGLGHGWKFEDGEPEDVVFDLTYEHDADADYFAIFAAAGWTHVLSSGHVHVFKAAPGTTPVHTAAESRRQELRRNVRWLTPWALLFTALFVLTAWLLPLTGVPSVVVVIALGVLLFPTIYTVLPLGGFLWHLARTPKVSA